MEHGKNWPPEYDHSVNFRDYVVHVYDNTAVMNFRFTVHEQITDSDLITEMRATETYTKQNGTWLLVARQWAPLPINFRKPVAVDASVYKDYVGQYQSRPLDDVETISVKDGKLWSQSGKDENEYLPLGSETFFIKNDIASITFSRDPKGLVTGYPITGRTDRITTSRRSSERRGDAVVDVKSRLHSSTWARAILNGA
jgi:hypothetical protein